MTLITGHRGARNLWGLKTRSTSFSNVPRNSAWMPSNSTCI